MELSEYKNKILHGSALDKLKELETESVDCCITSPPYWALRDYKTEGQLGLEPTFTEYIQKLVEIFAEVKRVLKRTGSLWVNLGDTYSAKPVGRFNGGDQRYFKGRDLSGHTDSGGIDKTRLGVPEKSLCLIPQRFQIAMVDNNWVCRNTIIWYKPNCMPSSARDRFTVDFEYLFFFTKSQRYYFETQFDPLNPETLRESKYTVNLTERKDQETRQGLNKWQPKKDYEGNNIQNPLSIKSRIVNNVYFGGNKYPGNVENRTYSGNQWNPTNIELSSEERKNAMSLGWDGVSDYANWYFNERPKRGWHNHEFDGVQGFSHQTTQVEDSPKKVKIPYPYGRFKRAVWKIAPAAFPDAHFATFPAELVETPIKATCPEYICRKCGKAREKVMEPTGKTYTEHWGKPSEKYSLEIGYGRTSIMNNTERMEYKETGLTDCGCGAGFDPGVCLDPFMGSGTTALVAYKLARNFVGIELSQEYIAMAMKRLEPYLLQKRLEF